MKFLACICGWFDGGYPDDVKFAGIGGILPCPECRKHERNPTLEGQYGNVEVITHVELFKLTYSGDWEGEFKKMQNERFEKERMEIFPQRLNNT